MTVATAQTNEDQAPKRLNRWDSPWLNPKFLIGLAMVLAIGLMAVIGPIAWDTNMAKVAKAPLNLPPPWALGYGDSAAVESTESDGQSAASDNGDAADESGANESGANESSESAGTSSESSITGGNPLAQGNDDADAESITGGNPLAQTGESSDTSGAITGGNPLAPAVESTESESTEVESDAAKRERLRVQRNSRFGTPSWDHPLGTESSGRDMLAVLLVGAPRSLWIGIIAAGIGMIVGIILGFSAGFLGGWIDAVIRTLSDAFITIPSLAVLIVISAFVSFNNITYMALMLAIFAWPGPTRLLRSQVLSMRERGYVQMARLSGAGSLNIMFSEMMPNLLPYLAASFTGNVSGAILAATGLEVLGLGPTRIPTLGITIFYSIRAAAILRGMWWWWGVPIVALIVIFTGLFLMTIGLDEIANPRLRGAKDT